MVKEKKQKKIKRPLLLTIFAFFLIGSLLGLLVLIATGVFYFEKKYQEKVYPGVRIDGLSFGGKTEKEVELYFEEKSKPLSQLSINLTFEDKIATLSGSDLSVSFDGKLLGIQAYSIGRSKHFFSNIYQKWQAVTSGINLPKVLRMNNDIIDETLNNLAIDIDISPQDALFQFENGKVTLFKLSKPGRRLDQNEMKQLIKSYISALGNQDYINPQPVTFPLSVKTLLPQISTENSNNLGIKELIGRGTSKFVGSIAGRIHNIDLAASKLNGHLIPPGAIFSFNDTLGDVSAATGFQPAYIIKEGRTVLGDGGGVCQVSTTLFRAALYSGLPIVERHAHAYRVSYYEQDSGPGLDATVFAPTHDLKFKNDTPSHILIQAKTDLPNYTLAFELYGTSDERQAEITKPVILSQTPPPDDLYQDDPTLPKGVVKQVDWKAWGAKVNFDYKVIRNGEIIYQQSFFSNFKPWQAVYLRGV
jgi:vancomycin resistance protein YoaR